MNSNTLKISEKNQLKLSNKVKQETFGQVIFGELRDAYSPTAENLIKFVGESVIGGKFLTKSAGQFFAKLENMRGFRMGAKANLAQLGVDLGMKIYNYLYERRPFGGQFIIHPGINQSIYRSYEHDYQMNRWLGQFPQVIYQMTVSYVYIETENCSLKNCNDTNAEVEYRINCNGRNLTFVMAIKNRKYMAAYWKTKEDAYNECYDLFISAEWFWRIDYGNLKYSSVQSQRFDDLLAIGGIKAPFLNSGKNYNPKMWVVIKPHVKGSRFPVAYEDCNFEGEDQPLIVDGKAGASSLGNWNDKISSLRIPPGFKVILFEHDNFQGARLLLTDDVTCLVNFNFNDKASSYIVVIDPDLK